MSDTEEITSEISAANLTPEQLQELLSGNMDPVALLKHIAETSPDKQARKEARRALYKLSKGEIKVSATTSIQTSSGRPLLPTVYATAFDGAGNRMLIFHIPDRDGGSPTVVEVLINDETGVERCVAARLSRQEAAQIGESLYGQLDTGLACSTIGYEYGRALLREAREINRSRRHSTPDGFLDWYERIGQPEEKNVLSEVTFRPDPDEETRPISDIFTLTWFDGWFFDVQDIAALMPEGVPDGDSPPILDKTQVAAALFTDRVRAAYERRLRESADILILRAKRDEARLALCCARELASDKPAAECEFALALADRSLLATMVLLRESAAAGAASEN